MVDQQVGFVQTLLCDNQAQVTDHSCHHLEGNICHLIQHCGDERFYDCEYKVPSLLIETVKTHSWLLVPLIFFIVSILCLAIIPEIL